MREIKEETQTRESPNCAFKVPPLSATTPPPARLLTSVPCRQLVLPEDVVQRYASLPGVLHMIELEKGKTGLGLSLAGNRDRSRMSVFVVGIDPNGAAGRDGHMVVGDELLEVFGRRQQTATDMHSPIHL